MTVELIIAANGPGELAGWVAPVARAARAQAGDDLRLTLALTPSQFANGHEVDVVRGWRLFDRIIEPSRVSGFALGIGAMERAAQSAVVHMGGDLWISARLAQRLRIRGCALVETPLIARRHRAFARIFTVSDGLTAALAERGVPDHKLLMTGDPRADAVAAARSFRAAMHQEGVHLVSFLPGSRDRLFMVLVPYFLRVASSLVELMPGTTFQIVTSPFLTPETVARVRRTAAEEHAVSVNWVAADPWDALASSDLALTIPGTNTLELALLRVPFAVVLETSLLRLAPMEGLLEWLARLPGLGSPLRAIGFALYRRRHKFVALPNLRAGRPVVPEWIGRWHPRELAKRVAELLRDGEGRRAMRETFRELYPVQPGAAAAVAASALALARSELSRP